MFNIEQLKEIQTEVISQMKVTELDSEGQKKSKVPYLQRLNAFFNGVHLVQQIGKRNLMISILEWGTNSQVNCSFIFSELECLELLSRNMFL